MPTIDLTIPKPYPQQQYFLDRRKRFNVADWGRRAGKTSMSPKLVCETLLGRGTAGGGKLGWFWPNYKVVEPFWNYYVELFNKLIEDKDETNHYLKLKTGGVLEAWSFGVSGVMARSRDYDRAIIEECREDTNLLARWEMEIRPTLIDRTGDAYFFSTPNGDDDFKVLFDKGNDENGTKVALDPDWQSTKMPTWFNPYLPQAERDRVRHQAEVLMDPVARQEYGAEFVSTADSFVNPLWVDACAEWGDNWQPLGRHVPICVGIDAASKNDTFAISGQGRHPITRKFQTVFSKVFQPHELVNERGITTFDRPKDFLRNVAKGYHVISFVYDPFQLVSTAGELQNENLGLFEEFPQTTKRALGDQFLYEIIRDRNWSYSGTEHEELAQHIKNANAKTEAGEKRRLVKRTDSLKIDAAVATSMALYALSQYNV